MARVRRQGATQSSCDPAYRPLRGQGATEYLVILAVVIIIALVAIALLGYFPGMTPDARISQSKAYWAAAKPFAIVDKTITAAGDATLVLQNIDASQSLTVTSIRLGGTNNAVGTIIFGPGETRNVEGLNAPSGTASKVYDLNVTISYRNRYGTPVTQQGSKKLTGRYI